jgi:hypothetical protein
MEGVNLIITSINLHDIAARRLGFDISKTFKLTSEGSTKNIHNVLQIVLLQVL